MSLPNDPDSGPRLSRDETAALYDAYKQGDAKHIGGCGEAAKGRWEVVEHSTRYFIFLNDIGPTEWCWEVSGKGAHDYCEEAA